MTEAQRLDAKGSEKHRKSIGKAGIAKVTSIYTTYLESNPQ
jgi:hypothetical protein